MQNIVIVGATSAIAKEVARIHARRGDNLFLLARDEQVLTTLAQDLSIRGAHRVEHQTFDATRFEDHAATVDAISNAIAAAQGRTDVVLIAHGTLPNQQRCQEDATETLRELNTNALSTVSLLTEWANRMASQGSGTIAVITSVAGDRGRQSNYVYGAAKKMVSTFLQGLRSRLHPHGVRVLDIKPGFVDTPMTAAFNKGPLWAQPERVAQGIVKAIDRRKHEVYLPWFWRGIMGLIRAIPEGIFKRMKL